MRRGGLIALAGTAVGVGAGLVAQRSAVARRRRNDPEAGQRFGSRRAERSRFITRPDGARLFVEESGPEKARRGAVFVHGSVLRTDLWHYQLEGIGDHRCLFYDIRGHGLSQPKGDAEYLMPTLAADLQAVIDDAGLEEVVVVGHSVGGMLALQLCVQEPDLVGDRIKGLVLCNTSSTAYGTTVAGGALARAERVLRHPLDALANRHITIEQLRKVIRPTDQVFLAVSLAAFGPRASAKQIDFTYDMLAETPADVIFDLFKCYRDFDVLEHLGEVDIPALVLAGTHDRITVMKASEELADRLPQGRLEVFDGCGHMIMLERHSGFGTLLEGFFDDVLGGARDRHRQEGADA